MCVCACVCVRVCVSTTVSLHKCHCESIPYLIQPVIDITVGQIYAFHCCTVNNLAQCLLVTVKNSKMYTRVKLHFACLRYVPTFKRHSADAPCANGRILLPS